MTAARTLSPEAILAECDRRMIALSLMPDGTILAAGAEIPPALARMLQERRDTFAPLIRGRAAHRHDPPVPKPQRLTPDERAALDAELELLGEEVEAILSSDALDLPDADAILLRVQRWFCAAGCGWLTEQQIGERRKGAGPPFAGVVETVYELVERGQLICCTSMGAPRFRLARPEEFAARRQGRPLADVYDRAAPVGAGAAGVGDPGIDESLEVEG